jgi:hypothetical protein
MTIRYPLVLVLLLPNLSPEPVAKADAMLQQTDVAARRASSRSLASRIPASRSNRTVIPDALPISATLLAKHARAPPQHHEEESQDAVLVLDQDYA